MALLRGGKHAANHGLAIPLRRISNVACGVMT
jgi:hypothetical protein